MTPHDAARARLDELGETRGWTRSSFAKQVHVSLSYLYRVLSGEELPGEAGGAS